MCSACKLIKSSGPLTTSPSSPTPIPPHTSIHTATTPCPTTRPTLTSPPPDPPPHNIPPTPKSNPEWTQTQPNGAPPIEKTFARAEVLIPVTCNLPPWMKSYIGVLTHPFYAVSAEDGTFTIKAV